MLTLGAGALGAPALAQTAQVQAVTLTPVQWRAQAELTASLAAPQGATLAASRGGAVTQVLFTSGQSVAAGQVLVQLDDGPEQAQLALDQARLAQAGRDLARTQKLMAISGASEASLEQAQAAQAEAVAQVKLDQANITQLRIIAPFAGITGIRNVDPGDYLQAGQAVVTLTASGPLRVLFSVPQTEASSLAVGDPFTLTAPLGTGTKASATGKLVALSPALDPNSDSRGVEGRLDDTPQALLAGMTGVVDIPTGAPQAAFSVPSTALNDSMLGPYIFIIKPGNTLGTVYVKILGNAGADSIVTAQGLNAGQKIVALGGFKLTDGASVTLASP